MIVYDSLTWPTIQNVIQEKKQRKNSEEKKRYLNPFTMDSLNVRIWYAWL